MKNSKYTVVILTLIILLLAYVSIFGIHNAVFNINIPGAVDMRFGIDIRGGVDAAFTPKNLDRAPTAEELEAAKIVIETRLDQKNILDRDVYTDAANGIIFVRFPWKSGTTDFDPAAAIAELGDMAELTFRDPDGNVIISGKNVAKTPTVSKNTSGTSVTYMINLTLDDEGRAAFAEATARLVDQKISIFMDEDEFSSPTVKEAIDSNTCVISDISSLAQAQSIANKIAAGALPFALETNNYSAISPPRGQNALRVMVTAGLLALLVICLFMIVMYRLSGAVACVTLILHVSGLLMLLSIPQITVTLPGIAGIILSVGMAVDANVIIAERIREELRSGKSLDSAIEYGYKRAMTAVIDGNITVLIVSVIMMALGSGAMLSFAFTLLFGLIMNVIAAIITSRYLLLSLTRFPFARKISMFMSQKSQKRELKIINFYGKRFICFALSGLVIIGGAVMIFVNGGVNLDIQFKGGAIYRYELAEGTPDIEPDTAGSLVADTLHRPATAQITVDYATNVRKLIVSLSGGGDLTMEQVDEMEAALFEHYAEQNLKRSESNNVSAYFGRTFLRNAILAISISSLLIILYLWIRFRRIHGLSTGVFAFIALLHDVAIVFVTFVAFNIPIGDTFVAVALTILGYSINDTIVIFDRLRENALFDSSADPTTLLNRSLSQVFKRTINTSLTTLFAVGLTYVFAALNGLTSITAFTLPMFVGVFVGCYSSIFIAGPLWVAFQRSKNQSALAKKKKTG